MKSSRDNNWDIFENKNNFLKITTRNLSRKTSRKRKLLWAKELTEVMAENKVSWVAELPWNRDSQLSGKKVKGILMKPSSSKQLKIGW